MKNRKQLIKKEDEEKPRRYINLLRCSGLSQAEHSPDDQKAFNDMFAQERGMQWVDDVHSEGVSGSQTFNRSDIEDLIRRKKEVNDFDTILVFDLSRMTRGGIENGFDVEKKLRKTGIKVISSTEDIPEGPEGDLLKSVKHYANQLQARSISLGVARGLSRSLENNNRPSASKTPYGLDRLFRGPNGEPRMLTRWDGREFYMYRPDENGVANKLIAKKTKPARGHIKENGRRVQFKGYLKQDDETSEFVFGSEQRLDTLRTIFRLYDLESYGYHRVANHLNSLGTPAPEGGRWTLTTIRNILRNPIYLGIEVRHRTTNALFHKLSPKGPIPVSVDQDVLEREGYKQVPSQLRPREEWKLIDKDGLKEILSEDVREKAMARIVELYDPNRKPHPKEGKRIHRGEEARKRHLNSSFILSGIMRNDLTSHPMRGESANRKMKHGRKLYRYYFDGEAAVFAENGTAARRLRAEPIEQAVLGVVGEVLGQMTDIEDRIRSIAGKTADQEDGERRAASLKEERENLVRRLREAYKLMGDMDGLMENEINADKDRIKAIDKELAELSRPLKTDDDIDKIVGRVRKSLGGLGKDLDDLPNAQIKMLLAALISDLRVDLETRALTIEMALPQSLLESGKLETVRPGSQWPWPSQAETNASERLKIANYRCEHRYESKQDCYTCRRMKRSA